jgi:hypothetical protein
MRNLQIFKNISIIRMKEIINYDKIIFTVINLFIPVNQDFIQTRVEPQSDRLNSCNAPGNL